MEMRITFKYMTKTALLWIALLVFLLSYQTVFAQSSQADNNRGAAIADYVRNKYAVRHMDSQLQKTEHGPSGTIYVIGDITPRDIGNAMAQKDKSDRARAIAKALILDEPDLFGIINPHELKEASLSTDQLGHTHIRYIRHIGNLPLDRMEIITHISPDEKLSSFSAEAVPTPPELHQAVTKETIKEEALSMIIEQDLKAAKIKYQSLRIHKNGKIAIPVPPYVLWQAEVSSEGAIENWQYRIDAFTGAVIERLYILRE